MSRDLSSRVFSLQLSVLLTLMSLTLACTSNQKGSIPIDGGVEVFDGGDDAEGGSQDVTLDDLDPVIDASGTASSVHLSLERNASITPFTGYQGAFFPRIFYNEAEDGFDFFMQGIIDPRPTSGRPNEFVAVKLDRGLNVVSEPVRLDLSAASGDMAMVRKDGHYFHIAGKNPGWALAKLDSTFRVLDEVDVVHDAYDRANDMVMSVTGEHLTMMALHASVEITPELMSGPGIWEEPTYGHIFVYDTDLEPAGPEVVLDVDFVAFGASIAQTSDGYAIITADELDDSTLSAYLFDTDWNHTETRQLAGNGQWSQGVVVDQDITYVAYHEGPHSYGDVIVSAFDSDWGLMSTINVTNFPTSETPTNALRPWLIKVDDKLYVSFDSSEGGVPKARVGVIRVEADQGQ